MEHSQKPLAVDLFTGLHGWGDGLVAEGYRVVGFDLEDMCSQFGVQRHPDIQLVLQDVRTIHGKQFKDASLIVASPPCQEFSYMAMPWSKAKEKARLITASPEEQKRLTELFDACFRIQREAIEAAGHFIPLVVENVRGAIPWVGRSRWNFGSFHLWGDVPALMPMAVKQSKVPAFPFDGSGRSFQTAAVEATGLKVGGFNVTAAQKYRIEQEGIKQGGDWFHDNKGGQRATSSKSKARKRYQAMIAKIPLPLSRHIAAVYRHPRGAAVENT